MRGWRSLFMFLAPLLALYGAFVGLFLSSPFAGVRSNLAAYAAFSLLALGISGVAAFLTILRAPLGVEDRDGQLLVRERWGSIRRYPAATALPATVLSRYPPGPLNDRVTVLVRLNGPDGRGRTYLIEEGLLETRAPPP